jgi:diguanylate cyclase (GGDEF)-like protein
MESNRKMSGNILIVDDNPDNLRALEGILAAEDHGFRAAVNREAALTLVAERPPDLIILDIMMPGMDGIDLCRSLKADPATFGIPVLFIGPLSDNKEKLRAFEEGCDDFIEKPFVKGEVLARVRPHLRLTAALDQLLQANQELSREIEARKSVEENYRECNSRAFQILHRISVPTFVIDMNHVITHWNKAVENLTGFSAGEMIGTRDQWRPLYPSRRPLMADLVVDNTPEVAIARLYGDKYRRSALIETAYEAVNFFPDIGETGRWLFFTAAPLTDSNGLIIGAIETLQDITEQKRAEEELRLSEHKYMEMSITDSLTKLYNSRQFFRQLGYETERAKRYGTPLSLVLLDIDNFKGFNDTYGHLEGDQVLKVLSGVIRRNIRDSDTACRYGGEEFTVLLPETEVENAFIVAERIRKDFEEVTLSPDAGSRVHMTISVGVSSYRADEQAAEFLKRVDGAMYDAKRMGKNRVIIDSFAECPNSHLDL